MKKRIIFFFTFCVIFSLHSNGKNYFVATTGNDTTGTGTITSPFASIMKAQTFVEAGDTVFIRGGNYIMTENQIAKKTGIWASVHLLDKSGTSLNRINYWAYPGERPVFDFSNIKPADYRIMSFNVTGSWLFIKGLEVIGTQVTIKTHTQSECFHNEGSNNIFEQLSMHDGQAIGFYLTKGSNNLILNCDAYRNYDFTSENGKGGNTDGFGCHPFSGGTGNVFRGCRAWFNSDDGYDCIHAAESVTFDHCWAFYNGYSTSFQSLGDGNGFKAGGWGATPVSKIPATIPGHTVQFCLAVRNKVNGFYSNHQLAGSFWYNNTAFQNAVNFNMLNRLSDNKTDVPGYHHVMKNNLSVNPVKNDTSNINNKTCDISFNSFTLHLNVSDSDFKSTDQSLLTSPRNSDGSLPDIDFLKLNAGSGLIDKGVDIGFQFAGTAPDLGAFEYQKNPKIK